MLQQPVVGIVYLIMSITLNCSIENMEIFMFVIYINIVTNFVIDFCTFISVLKKHYMFKSDYQTKVKFASL